MDPVHGRTWTWLVPHVDFGNENYIVNAMQWPTNTLAGAHRIHDCINKPKCEENNIIKLESGTNNRNVCRSRFQKFASSGSIEQEAWPHVGVVSVHVYVCVACGR